MTTEKQEVSASQDSADEIASTVLAAQNEPAQAEEQVQEQVPEQAPVSSGPTLSDIENVFNKYQGTQNNWNASRMKQIEDNLQTKVDEALKPFRDLTSTMEQARVEQLEPEDQVDYWRNKAQTPEDTSQQQQQQQQELSDSERLGLANSVTQLITQNGLQMTHLDNRIWEGAMTGMTAEQYYTLAQNNIGRLRTTPAPAPAATPAPATPPPTTQGAPSQTTSPIETKSEAVEAFQRGDINIDEYRSIGTEKGWMRR
jgi:hypothetical protein|tara:strand:- start:63 stop:830 length:768 start_codon:yes stop_codon:yes gene_type:complete